MRSILRQRRPSSRNRFRKLLGVEFLESRQLMAGDIAGTIFEDLNQNGVRDGGENGVQAGWRVFVDTNLDGRFTGGEASALTNKDGDYLIKASRLAYSVWPSRSPQAGRPLSPPLRM